MMTTADSWPPATHAAYDRLEGREVFDADGEKLGAIVAILHPTDEPPGARGGHVLVVKPDPLADGADDEDLFVATPLLGGLMLRPDDPADPCGDRDPLYVSETAIAGIDAVGVTLTCTCDEFEARE